MRRTASISLPTALYVSFVLVASMLSASPPTGRIAGTVTDASTGLPIPGVEVQLVDAAGFLP